jgi:diguanylate cyclase (GGDEF)-like protein
MPSDAESTASWLVGDGEIVELIRAKDWTVTPLGPLSAWPESLRTTVSLILASSFPLNLIWGPGAVQIWNQAYADVCGEKHPSMFGSDYRECWASAWPAIGGAFDQARAGHTSFLEDQPMLLDRNGYLEEAWFTFSLSPIRDEHGDIAGLFHPVTETSARMLTERRARVLHDLTGRVGNARSTSEALAGAIEVLARAAPDVPLALVYLRDEEAGCARLCAHTSAESDARISEREILLSGDSPVAVALRDGAVAVVDKRALVAPIISPGADRPIGAVVLGISTRLALDVAYRGFLDLVAQGITLALASATAHEQDRARAEGLAKLDRAKTAFFTNVSHEFRTPLTLMLGPLEQELAECEGSPDRRDRLEMAHRNGLRLLRLVNALLDFSRAEAGRVEATFQPTDLAAFTADLAGAFREAVETAGLTFTVACEPLPEAVFVDRQMWEQIVMNLLANALKHTFDGGITLALRWQVDHARLLVSDTGVGIPAEELPRLFERFYRVKDARARTIEGTGIGLALVRELAQRHGGDVTVDSSEGIGTTLAVNVRGGCDHLPAELVSPAGDVAVVSGAAAAQADDAKYRLARSDAPTDPDEQVPALAAVRDGHRPRVLIADDNEDMRHHLVRVLETDFDVVTASNGIIALEAALAAPPDLVLTDVMMPLLDGFGLLQALREHDGTRAIPVIMLSARAGEQASIEGMRAGVDDYLAKPFSAQELIARVSRSLALARLRHEHEQLLASTNDELARAVAELETTAHTDPLTGLPNRRTWDEELPKEIARARRSSYPLCVALLDVDGLKAFNDTYGHPAADALLRDAGVVWRTALRTNDLVARVGGDEFAVLMPDCSLGQARTVLERVHGATPGDQTCSAGLVCWDRSETNATLIARADAALYQAKRAGSGLTVAH